MMAPTIVKGGLWDRENCMIYMKKHILHGVTKIYLITQRNWYNNFSSPFDHTAVDFLEELPGQAIRLHLKKLLIYLL